MKILISLAGNICSGKTTIGKLLSSKLTIPLFSIDEYRIRFHAFTISGENEAWEQLKRDIGKVNFCILESTGLSKNLPDIYRKFDRIVTIVLDADERALEKRLAIREKEDCNFVPYAFSNGRKRKAIMEIGPKIRRIRADLRFDTSKIDPRKIAEEVIAYYRKIKKE